MMSIQLRRSLAVLTSGGDAPGMNGAVRAAVRTALSRGVEVYAIYEGYQGLVNGGDYIRKMTWGMVGGILNQGGTVIGSARCVEFREREGRLQAARNLIERNIDSLIVIGGDGSLTGANLFRQEWPDLLAELAQQGYISQDVADNRAKLSIVGLVGSIDNDMFGTDMTIGADTALHRITEAVDALTSTASSHKRTFIVEVMGRNCGYLALMSSLAAGANWVFIPENPPNTDDWETRMCQALAAGRKMGRRQNLIFVAEGARDRDGNPISPEYIKQVLEEQLGEDTRITTLGHVQRGGAPSAYDRYLSTITGYAAVETLLSSTQSSQPQLIGIRENNIIQSPLMDCVAETRHVADVITDKDYEHAMKMRGGSFAEAFHTFHTLTRIMPHEPEPNQKSPRLAILHSGGPSPGMNTAVRVAVRLGIDKGYTMLAVRNGFQGFVQGDIEPINWMNVSGWVSKGGAELGTNRKILAGVDFEHIAAHIKEHDIQGLFIIGGWAGYRSAYRLMKNRDKFPAFNIPIICLPATINNNLPGTDFSIGADTALNCIVDAVDKIKQSAVASQRCFVVEVMGRYCGYLALMSGLATGAERVYLHEEGISLRDLQADLDQLIEGFKNKKRLGLMIRNEKANQFYTTDFICSLFEEEGGDLFDVRQAILGHLQQGGNPSPFDRIQATRFTTRCLEVLNEEIGKASPLVAGVGLQAGKMRLTKLENLPVLMEQELQRPRNQWWLKLLPIAKIMAQPGPQT